MAEGGGRSPSVEGRGRRAEEEHEGRRMSAEGGGRRRRGGRLRQRRKRTVNVDEKELGRAIEFLGNLEKNGVSLVVEM